MKIMSFNTQQCRNYYTRNLDYEIMAKAITDYDADIVGLNEMYGDQTEQLSKHTKMENWFFAPALGVFGNGFLSKMPIKSVENIPIPDPNPRGYDGYYETRCLLKAEYEDGLTVLVTHFGKNPDEQENAVKTVLEHLKDEKCVFMGDLNVHPDNPVLLPIMAKMKDAADLFDEPKSSYPSDAPYRKIDYIFVSPDIEIVDADIPPVVASDHRPHVATIKY